MAGTGTDVGKTLVAAGIVRLLRRRGVDGGIMKPVQTGAVRDRLGRLSSPDLDFVLAAAGLAPDGEERELLAPFLFEPACSPHLAARLAGEEIRVDRIVEAAKALSARRSFLVVEGAGGLLVPLGGGAVMADLPRALALPVLLVGHGGLGAINHVLLSLEALRGRGIAVAAVVLNEVRPVPEGERFLHDDNAAAVEEWGRVPVAARLPWLGPTPDLSLLDEAIEGSPLAEVVHRLADPMPSEGTR